MGDQVWLHINKERLQGEGKNLKLIWYGPFKILANIGNNVFQLDLPPYMKIYSIVNFEILIFYEPPMIMDQEESIQVPSIEYFSPEYMYDMQEDIILDRKTRTSHKGDVEYLHVGLKGTNPSKAQWIKIGKVREIYAVEMWQQEYSNFNLSLN